MPNQVTLITGSNGGIGQHIVRHLLLLGDRNVFCHYRSDNDGIVAALREAGLDADRHSFKADLGDEASIDAMARFINSEFGGVRNLINVAGSSSNAMSWKMSKSEFTRILNDSLVTTFLCCKAFVPEMRERRNGRIVNFSSVVGATGVAGAAHYAAAKAGLIGFTKSLALELASRGITANAVALGYFDTGLIETVPPEIQAEIMKRIPVGRFGSQSDIGGAVKYLISDEAEFLTGQVIHLNGGQY